MDNFDHAEFRLTCHSSLNTYTVGYSPEGYLMVLLHKVGNHFFRLFYCRHMIGGSSTYFIVTVA